MQKKFPYPIAVLVGCVILIQPGIIDSIVAFWLIGLIPGTAIVTPSPIMLAIMFTGAWLVIRHFILPRHINIRAYITEKKQKFPRLVLSQKSE